jgi:hypothetical protein
MMLKDILADSHMSQICVSDRAAMHRTTVSKIISCPENAHPIMFLRLAEAYGLLKFRLLHWYCMNACPIGKALAVPEYREVSLARSACGLYASVTQLNTALSKLLSVAADDRVDCSEEKDLASVLKNIREVKQAISDIELWVSLNPNLLTKKEIANAVTLTTSVG